MHDTLHDTYYITYSERRRIEIMSKRGVSPKEIAQKLGVHIPLYTESLKEAIQTAYIVPKLHKLLFKRI